MTIHNYIQLLKISLKYWPRYILTIISMFGYAIFSVASIPLFIPLMDDVLNREFQDTYAINDLGVFLANLKDTISAYLEGQAVDPSTLNSAQSEIGALLKNLYAQTDPVVLLYAVIIGLLIFTILKLVFFIMNRIAVLTIEGASTRDLKRLVFVKYMHFPFAFFERHKVGDALVRLSSDAAMVTQKLLAVVLNNIRDLIMVLLYLFSALYLNAPLFVKIIIFIPFLLLFMSLIGKKIKQYSKRLQKQLGILFNKVEEVFRGLKIVRAFSKEDFESEKFGQIAHKEYSMWFKRSYYDMLHIPISELSGMGIAISIFWFGGNAVIDPGNNFSFGEFIAFLTAILLTLNPMKATLKNYSDIKKATVSLNRIYEVLNREDEIIESEEALRIDGFHQDIQLKNVSFAYGQERTDKVLSDINLTIKQGEKVAFVGATGSGKTTLVNLIPRYYDVTSGVIQLDGKPINEIAIKDLRRLFGYVTQESFLFNESIAYNISYGSTDVSTDDIRQACEIANASEFIDKLPDGYDTIISNYGANFSGGQRQRLCIARAIVGNPKILIFDEATSALDSEAELKVQEAIDRATADKTLLVIAHRLSTILKSDKIVVIKNGTIDAVGKHDALLNSNSEYTKLYNLQFNNQQDA
jgi:ABC-type multidrug transport system fused ATPase/permease subunit